MIKNYPYRIAVASGKGGTGKTFIATNLFCSLIKTRARVALVDCDAEAPNAALFFSFARTKQYKVFQKQPYVDEAKCTFCGKCREYCSYNAIICLPQARLIKVIDELCHGCGACSVACAFSAIRQRDVQLGEVNFLKIDNNAQLLETKVLPGIFSPVPVIKKGISMATDAWVIILDSPPGTSCPFIHTVNKADYTVLVAEPTPFGLSDLKQSVKVLKGMKKDFGVIVNREGIGSKEIFSYLEKESVKILDVIPFDKDISYSYSDGRLLAETNEKWENRFLNLLNLILKEGGNSNNQW